MALSTVGSGATGTLAVALAPGMRIQERRVSSIVRPFRTALDWFRFLLRRDPRWDWTMLTFPEFEQCFRQSAEQFRAIHGAEDPVLRAFRDRGGRLILYHGWADQTVPPRGTIAYYERVQEFMGGADNAAAFARLYMVLGGTHSFRSAVSAPTGQVDALLHWVEHGIASDRLLAELRGPNGQIVRPRPLFPYRRIAKCRGTGSTDVADNFVSSLSEP